MAMFSLFVVFAALLMANAGSNGAEIEMPPGCEGLSYCTIQPDYHTAQVADMDRAIQKSKYWEGISAQNNKYDGPREIYPTSDSNNCASVIKVEQPFIIRVDMKNPVNKLVVQSDKFTQMINTTSCQDKDMPCFEVLKAQQNNIETSCDERNSTITIYVFEGGHIKPQPFKIPVSCSCIVKFKDDYK